MKYPKRIDEELKRVTEIRRLVGDEFIRSKKYKDDREWWVLGTFMGLFKKRSLDCPSYAIKSEHPDFLTFRNETQPYRPVEIVEFLRLTESVI